MKWKSGKRMELSEEPDKKREEFLRLASDRLKTPVTTLGLALQRLEEAHTEKERKEFLEMAKRGQQEMGRAVEEVLNKARQDRRN